MLLILLLLLGCSAPNFKIFKQNVEFKGNLNKEYAYKVATYVANKLNFKVAKEDQYKVLCLVKSINIGTKDDYKTKANEKIENSRELILIVGISDEGYVIKPFIKKDMISISSYAKGIAFKNITDAEIVSSQIQYAIIEDGTDEDYEVLSFIENLTDILRIKKDIQKLNSSELKEEEKSLLSIEGE